MSSFPSMRTTTYAGHQKSVNAVAWNSLGECLASASSDGTTRLWQMNKGTLIATGDLVGHKKNVMQASWSPRDAACLATASHDKTVRFWDIRSKGAPTAVIETSGENINLAYSRDGNCVVVGNKKDKLTWIDVRTAKSIGDVSFQTETNEFAFDGGFFFATTGKGTLDVYSGSVVDSTFKKEMSLPAHSAGCMNVTFAPNGKLFAVGSVDSLVSFWDRGELLCLRTMSRFRSAPRSLSFSFDSQFLASGGEDAFIDVANVSDASQVSTIKVGAAVNSLSWHPTSLMLAYAASSSSGNVYLLAPEIK
jgi:THO complex subunit 3